MKFIPNVNVINNQRLMLCGVEYDIAPNEAEGLKDYGTLLEVETEDNKASVKKAGVEKPKSTAPKKKGNKKS